MTSYEPKAGTGWEEGPSPLVGVRRWRILLETDLHLSVTFDKDCAVISRVTYESVQVCTVPMPEDLGRIERDFGVHGWSIVGVSSVLFPSEGKCLLAKAVWRS